MDLQDFAQEYAEEFMGNHKSFRDFGWSGEPEDSEHCGIYYYMNRDSALVEQANADSIKERMEPYLGSLDDGDDAEIQCHSHWGPGWLEGLVVRVVNKDGEFTPAFMELVKILMELENYPLLDEMKHSEMEYEDTLNNIGQQTAGMLDSELVPEGWEVDVFRYLDDNYPSSLDGVDGFGGYPAEELVVEAIAYNGWLDMENLEYCFEHGQSIFAQKSEEEQQELMNKILAAKLEGISAKTGQLSFQFKQ